MVNRMKKVKLISADSQESIEMEEYSDEDDDVFPRNNSNGDTVEARRPLMRKKKRKQNGELHATVRSSNPKYRRCCGPICWAFLAFKSLIGALIITIITVNYFTHSGWYFWRWGSSEPVSFAPCHDLEITPVWQMKFPKLGIEGHFRLLNISKDEVLDIVFGFGTGADGYDVPDMVCDIYFAGKAPCFGGVMALDGRTGQTLWTRWAKHEIFALTCQGDLNNDSTTDCIAGGRAGVLFALSGSDGSILWEFGNHAVKSDLMSLYAAQFIHDLTGDGLPEILAVHGGDDLSDPALEEKMFGRLIIFDGRNGTVLRWMQTPDRRESYYPPQIITWLDGEQFVIFGTGGNLRSGSLYVISLVDLYKRKVGKAVPIYKDDTKGMLTPAALVDIDGDNIEDIVIATFNSHVIAFSGKTFTQIWKTSFANSESYSTIGVGFYDDDDIPDFLVKYQHGPGYPVYDFEQTVVLSGKNGSKISDTMTDSIGSQSSPLTLMTMGRGNDIFLHWTSNCKGHDKEHLQYSFPDDEPMHDQMRADICGSLFGTRQEATFLALQRFNSSREISIYNSLRWDSFEHENSTNTSALADQFMKKHPNLESTYKSSGDKYSVLPYKKDDFNSLMELLQKDIERDQDYSTDPENVGYAEGEEQPEGVRIQLPKQDKRTETGEVMDNVAYSQPHNVQKNRPELGSQMDTFENPYVRNYPQSQQPLPPYQQGYSGRNKRQAQDYFWGIHRIMSTGTLAPPMLGANDTMDVIFATHWIYPSRSPVLQADDKKCIDSELEQRNDLDQLTEEDLTALKEDILSNCLKKSGHGPNKDAIYETPSDYDPFKVNMGQLTVYRFTLRCVCQESLLTKSEKCGRFLPYQQQGWPSFMAKNGDARLNVREILKYKMGFKR